jgi:hypothetical protein
MLVSLALSLSCARVVVDARCLGEMHPAASDDDGKAALKITRTWGGWAGSRPIRSSVGLHL